MIAARPAITDPPPSPDFIADAIEAVGKLAYCKARLERAVQYLETDPNPDHRYVLTLLRGALLVCREDWRR